MAILEHAATYRFVHDADPNHGLADMAHVAEMAVTEAANNKMDIRGMRVFQPSPEGVEAADAPFLGAIHLSMIPVRGMRRRFGHDIMDCLVDPHVRQSILDVPEINQRLPATLVDTEIDPEPTAHRYQAVHVTFRFSEADEGRLHDHQQEVLRPIAEATDVKLEDLLNLAQAPHLTIFRMSMKTNSTKRAERRILAERIAEALTIVVNPESPLPISLSPIVLPKLPDRAE